MEKTNKNTNTLPVQLLDIFTQYKDKPSIEYGQRIMKYCQLDKKSNDIANWIVEKGIQRETFIGVLAGDRIHFICAMMGILKAGCAFVPLDPANPPERLDKMIESIDLKFLFIDRDYHAYSRQHSLRERNIEFIEIDYVKECQYNDGAELINRWGITYTHEDKVYVYFTSGTTGVPKAIIGKSKSLLHYCQWEIETFKVGKSFRISQFATTSDAFLKEVFVTFLSGATLCIPGDFKRILNSNDLIDWIEKHRINMVHCVPHVFRLFGKNDLAGNNFPHLKYVVLSGEKLYPQDFKIWFEKLGERIQIVNLYGTTETTILNTFYFLKKSDVNRKRIPIGKPMKGNRVIILDENMNICNKGIPGEIYIRTPYRTFGYYNDAELNRKKFIRNPFNNDPDDLIFKTGDLGRLLPDGNIEFLGRIDRQVKIRGHRIELEEIEHVLMTHPDVKEAVVIKKAISHDNELLYAYFTRKMGNDTGQETLINNLTDFLLKELPEYMVPDFFLKMDTIPRKPNRKIDYDLLPDPFKSDLIEYICPGNATERKLSRIWSEILKLEKISMKSNFFKIGGHSLNVMSLTYKIHKEFDVKISLAEIFKNPTLEKQAEIIKNKIIEEFAAIAAVEKKEFYPLSSAQKRLYILQQFVAENISYNETQVMMLQGFLEIEKIGRTFRKLLERHEILRTSFVTVNDNPVQRIYKNVKFNIEYSESSEENTGLLIKSFIRPFDLSTVPLVRVNLIKVGETKHIMVVDIHHIISDRVSLATLIQEFMTLYGGRDLSSLRVQYKDYSGWQNSDERKELLKNQEKYWVKEFAGEIPVLSLPIDFPRPEIQDVEGRVIGFEIGSEESQLLKQLALKEESSLFMVLLTMYNILLSKLSGQEDIVVGTPIAGRSHADLEHIIGMFVNTLALRNFPGGKKSFKDLLYHIKTRSLSAFENQDFQFEDLVEKVEVTRDAGRNPLFDVMLVLQNVELESLEIPGLKSRLLDFEKKQTKFDLTLTGGEFGDKLFFSFEYSTKLFKEETIKRYISYFRTIITSALADIDRKIFEIQMIREEEKNRILIDFNNTGVDFLEERLIHELVERQVEKTPNRIAVTFDNEQQTYKELNDQANRLARHLREKGAKPDTVVGIVCERSIEMMTGIFAILKSGSAYLPLDPDYPENKIQYMLEDSQLPVLLTQTHTMKNKSFTALKGSQRIKIPFHVTDLRPQVTDLDALPIPNRSLVNYEKYNQTIGHAMVKNSIVMQATRGCPFHCAYCHKIWPKTHVVRSAQNVFDELMLYYEMGVKRFVFIDDIFNLDIKNSTKFFQLIIKNTLDVQLFFPNGFRGDILTKEYIDLAVKAGTVSISLSLETACPRLQKLIKKSLNLQKLKENIKYICETYPQVILELQLMHGFPSETQEEAMMTLDFVKSIQWVHFPYLHILKIYPNTDMADIALVHGVSPQQIKNSASLAFHELPDTLPFEKSFTLKCQADFFNDYFLSKERLLHVLPYQMKILTTDEIVQKYNSYLPVEINSFDDLLGFINISYGELADAEGRSLPDEDTFFAADFNKKVKKHFPENKPFDTALRILLLDLSQFFSNESNILYDVVEAPLGLMNVLTYLTHQLGAMINGKIAKSRIDFNSYAELKQLLTLFKPDVIGIRTLTYYKEFFHKTVALIRNWGYTVPIIAGGPYATSDYNFILQDSHVDLVVLGEGEITFSDLIKRMIENGGGLPGEEVLREIPGIAYVPGEIESLKIHHRDLLIIDALEDVLSQHPGENPTPLNQPSDMAYVIYTSGTTGRPKGVMIQHHSVINRLNWMQRFYPVGAGDVFLQKTPIIFDVSVWELFWWAFEGASLYLLEHGAEKDPGLIIEAIETKDITVIHFVPSMLNAFLDYIEAGARSRPLRCLKRVFASGEALTLNQVKKFKELFDKSSNTELINLYGPTEATVDVSYFNCPEGMYDDKIPIGKPIDNINLYVIDSCDQLQPIGIEGELGISGCGLARGYLNKPELTNQKFVTSQFVKKGKLFKTGDWVKWLDDGNIEFLGRIDHQVKLRGYRIELEEIENQLRHFPTVKDAVVIFMEKDVEDKHLIAYVVPESGYGAFIKQLAVMEKNGLLDGHQRCELPDGMSVFYLNRNETAFMYNEIFQQQCYLKHGITLDEVDCIFDIGANIGMFSLFISQQAANVKIYAFEPIPPIFEILTLNSTLYNLNIELFPYGISKEEAEVDFTYYPENSILSGYYGNSAEEISTVKSYLNYDELTSGYKDSLPGNLFDEMLENRLHYKNFRCPLKSISQVIRENRIEKIDLLKIDVEKSEIDVLKGINEEDWPKIRQVALEVHNVDGRLNQVKEILNNKGYEVVVEQARNLQNTNIYNLFAVPPGNKKHDESSKKQKDKMGCGFINITPEQLERELKNDLKKNIPEYMVPSRFVFLQDIPLTSNGKVDRRVLPKPETVVSREKYNAPRSKIERMLVDIWSDVLNIEKEEVGIDDNFFDIGGHSLKATVVIAKIQKKLKIKILLAEFFKSPTLRALSRYIEKASPEDSLLIHLAEKKEYYPLSSAQKRLYILNRMEGEGSTFNIIRIYSLEGKLDCERLKISFKTLINRHAALRTSFKMVESEPVQMIQDDVDFFIEHFEDSTGNVEQIVKDFMVPLDLARAPLLKAAIIKINDLKHILVMNIHHIIADGISMSIFQEELLSLYMGTELAINKTQYQDFSQWRNQSIISEKIKRQEAYWLKIFENDVPVLNIPTDYPRPDLLGIDSDSVEFVIHRELNSSIQEMMSRRGTTLYIFFLSVFSILLSKYTQQEDIVIGTPIAGRRHADLNRIMGLFANMLPLRNYPQDNKTFISFLDEVKETAINGYENQDSQFEELVWKLGIENQKGHQPLVDIVFVLQNMDFPSLTSVKDIDLHLPKLSFLSHRQEREICRYDLLLEAFEIKDEIHFDLKFRTCLFKKDTIERMASHFKNIVKEVLKNPGTTIQNIQMLDPGEKEKLLAELRGSKDHGYLNEKSIHKKDSKKLEALFNF